MEFGFYLKCRNSENNLLNYKKWKQKSKGGPYLKTMMKIMMIH